MATNKKYPKRAAEVLAQLKARQTKQDVYVRKMVKQAVDSVKRPAWPMQFSRLELNGLELRSVVVWECPNCLADGVATSLDQDGKQVECWHCSQCDQHVNFQVATNLR